MSSGYGSANGSLPTLNEANLKTILVCGVSGVGKSRFINTVTGSNLPVGHSTFSETKDITEEGIPMIKMGDKFVQLVDTPGFQDSRDEDEVPVFQNIADWLVKRYIANFRVTGFIYLRSIQEPRVLRAETALMKMFKKLCGEEAIDHIVLTTNRWQPPPEKEEEDRETEMVNDVRRFGGTGSKRVQVQRLNGKYQREDALRILEVFRNLGPVTLQVQHEMVEQKMRYSQTAAGREIQSDLENKIRELTASLKEQQENNSRLKENGEMLGRNMKLIQQQLKSAEEQNESLKESIKERGSGGHFWDSVGRVAGAIATLGISEAVRD